MPDLIEAVVRTADPVAALQGLQLPATVAPVQGTATRTSFGEEWIPTDLPARSTGRGVTRASLLVGYAAARTFYPYFVESGDELDARLDQALALAEGADTNDRMATRRAIAYFGESLHDAHAASYDLRATEPGGMPSVSLISIGAEWVVAASQDANVRVGEVILSIDGRNPIDVYKDVSRFVGGSPQSVRARATEQMISGSTKQLVLRGASGPSRTVALSPGNGAGASTFGLYDRPYGALTDLAAPDIYYVSLNDFGGHAPTQQQVAGIVEELKTKRGLVLDMRGYPGQVAWQLLSRVASQDSFGPQMYQVNVGHETRERLPNITQTLADWDRSGQTYTGPVVVLTGPMTQSQAEHWTFFFRSRGRGKLIGGKTSGANGDITSVQMPGGFAMLFTGMHVTNPDGSRFHGVGIAPDIAVEPTLEDIRAGRDAVLLRAIAELSH